nr:hypothetical protein [Tanacetum cinerariifolium]
QFSKAYSEASHISYSIPRKEKDPGSFTLPCFINNVCFDNALADLGASVSVMPLSTYINLGLGELVHTRLTIELADRTVKYPKEIVENVLVGIGKFVFPIDFIIIDMPKDIKVPLILEIPFLSTSRAKIDVFKRKITLRVGEEKIIFKSVKPVSSLIKRVYMLSLRERIELDFEARLMGETLEGEVLEEFRARNDDRMDSKVFGYPSDCDHDKKIRMDYAYNLKFSCMIGLRKKSRLSLKNDMPLRDKAASGLRRYHFTYPERRLTMEEMLYKFIDKIKREHEEMRTFIYMPEDFRVPLALGRPFLATTRAMIDMFNKKIKLRVGDDEVIFNVDQSIKRPPAEDDECYEVDDLDDTINAEA